MYFGNKCLDVISMIDERRNKIEKLMILEGSLPKNGIFQISDDMLHNYVQAYNDLNGNGVGVRRYTNYKFARKIAGMNLLSILYERGAKYTEIKSGMVYVIGNPVFTEHYKIGITLDLGSRLSSYQTSDPLRRYHIVKYQFVEDRKRIEKTLLSNPNILKEEGEWVKQENALEIFDKICQVKDRRNELI